jgi:hypothetical protein
MSENVVYLHGQPKPIGRFLRIGSTGHRQLETLHGSGKLHVDRVVVEASQFERQKELVGVLAESGVELTLETNVAELSSIGRFEGSARSAPWANPTSMLTPDDLLPSPNRDVIGQIARFAVSNGFHVVQAPTHLLSGAADKCFGSDRDATTALRKALDAEGGKNIGIAYPLLISYADLRDPIQRRTFVTGLGNLPLDSLWLRVSGFGADAGAARIRRYIAAALGFQQLNVPIVADGVGGIAGLALAAFGVAGAICHGVGRERFNATDWTVTPKGNQPRIPTRILVNGLDRQLTVAQLDELMKATSGRRLLGCNDRRCCPNGHEDTVRDPKAHFLFQRAAQYEALSKVPESRRAQDFLDRELAVVERTARNAAKLNVSDPSLKSLLVKNSERLDKMVAVLGDLKTTIDGTSRALIPERRTVPADISKFGKR